MNKWAEILLGLILFIGIIVFSWFSAAYSWTIFGKSINLLTAGWILLKGAIFWIILLTGFLLIILGISDLQN